MVNSKESSRCSLREEAYVCVCSVATNLSFSQTLELCVFKTSPAVLVFK